MTSGPHVDDMSLNLACNISHAPFFYDSSIPYTNYANIHLRNIVFILLALYLFFFFYLSYTPSFIHVLLHDAHRICIPSVRVCVCVRSHTSFSCCGCANIMLMWPELTLVCFSPKVPKQQWHTLVCLCV